MVSEKAACLASSTPFTNFELPQEQVCLCVFPRPRRSWLLLCGWVSRYMSTRDAGEQRSLLRVISTILQMTRQEAADVEARISELEKTMVSPRNRQSSGMTACQQHLV